MNTETRSKIAMAIAALTAVVSLIAMDYILITTVSLINQ